MHQMIYQKKKLFVKWSSVLNVAEKITNLFNSLAISRHFRVYPDIRRYIHTLSCISRHSALYPHTFGYIQTFGVIFPHMDGVLILHCLFCLML